MNNNPEPQAPNQPQPAPNQPTPSYPNPGYPNQPYPGQLYPNQPYPNNQYPNQYPQPMVKPPKQPMDPAKKKKIITIVSICSGVGLLAVIAAIVIPIILRVDYSTAYKTAKDLKPKIQEIYYSYDCKYVSEYLSSSYTSIKSYNEDIEGCLEVFGGNTNQLVAELGETDGIKRNTDLKNQYEKFNAEYAAISAGSADDLAAKLELYKAWHSFVVTNSDLNYAKSTDAEFTAAANYLINSGNDTLKTYGENWLEKSLALSAARRAWDSASFSASNYSELRNDYNNKYSEMKDWVATNAPDVKSLAPLSTDDTSKAYSEFEKLYSMISETYEKNYNSGSGDCTEFLGDIYCE